ncbi:MAG: transposase [Nitrosomonas sp.]|nr:MAG: transposase [Nitrosomonas sp.]
MMEITETQYQQIKHCMPRLRGDVSHQSTNSQCYSACYRTWLQMRGLPKRFGNWHTIYTRMNRWAKSGCCKKFLSSCSNNKSYATKSKSFRSIAPASKCIPMALVH